MTCSFVCFSSAKSPVLITAISGSPGKSGSKGKKGGKKRNPWSDSEEDEDLEISDLSDDMGTDNMAAAIAAAARDRGPRRAAGSLWRCVIYLTTAS